MQLSTRGADFILRHEGFRSKAYRDPVGVITIGAGYTNRSQVFRAYWRKTRGHDLRLGDTIGRGECMDILPAIANEEYGAAVNSKIAPKAQHHYDAATSVCFNLGPAAAGWKWAVALRGGRIADAVRLLRVTGTTAGGRRLEGLVIRRRHEAALIETGDYGDGKAPAYGADDDNVPSATDDRGDYASLLRGYQEDLKALGFDPGPIDGIWGRMTRAAVLAFQKHHADLVNDGILGPATRASIDRAMDARGVTAKSAGGIALAAVAAVVAPQAGEAGLWVLGAALAVAAVSGVAVWRYRGEIKHWWRG